MAAIPRYYTPMPKASRSINNPHLEELAKRVAQAPTKPGIYRWLSADGTVLYVGKAKNLKNRLKSYLPRGISKGIQKPDKSLGPWKLSLVKQITDLDMTVTQSELEALVLETNLIKEIRPKYNVLMKDDKNYVYIRISIKDPYPSIEITRRMEPDGAKYFGPFLGAMYIRKTLDMLHDVYHWKACQRSLDRLNSTRNSQLTTRNLPLKPCLEFQIGKCCGLCIEQVTQEEYRESIENVVTFLKGNYKPVMHVLTEQMKQAALDKKFERAAKLRDIVRYVQSLNEKQIVSDTTGENTDIIGIATGNGKTQVVILHERGGKVIDETSMALQGEADTIEEILVQFLPQYFTSVTEFPDTVVIPQEIAEQELLAQWISEQKGTKVELRVPERGKKAQLLEMAQKNAQEKLAQQAAKWEAAARNIETALTELQKVLKLPDLPKRIEGYDISHLGGTETVGSMVVMKNGKPANDQYRSFTLRTIKEGEIDDYKALYEMLRRRLLHITRNVKVEEQTWKKSGITFGKARKAEQKRIGEMIEKHQKNFPEPRPKMTEFFVARKEEAIVACAALQSLEGTVQLAAQWAEEKQEAALQFLLRKMLSSVKKGKVYLCTQSTAQEQYMDIGFRPVHTAPAVIMKHTEDDVLLMTYEVAHNKPDSSLTVRPDLLMIDGGKGQLSTVQKVLEKLKIDIPVIGLAKQEEQVFHPRLGEVHFGKDSQGRFLLMRLRDEAHRFANIHREKRLKMKTFTSELDGIPGLGSKTKQQLLQQFHSVQGVRGASDAELKTILTQPQLAALREYWKQ